MGFNERLNLASNMENILVEYLVHRGFILEKTGYEKYVSNNTREILRHIHDDTTIKFLRYMPDYFASIRNQRFFIEFKVMDSPILLDSRVNELKAITKYNDLTKSNIGVVETAAIENYQNLSKIGVKILVVVFCTFNYRKLLVEWEEKLCKFFDDKVRLGKGNASFTPYTNIHLDKMRNFQTFFKEEFDINIDQNEIEKIIKNIEKN